MANDKQNRRILIESDGTFGGTKVEIDGKAVGGGAKKLDSVTFMAEGPFDGSSNDSFFRFRASTKEKDGDTERISTIRISNWEDEAEEIVTTLETVADDKTDPDDKSDDSDDKIEDTKDADSDNTDSDDTDKDDTDNKDQKDDVTLTKKQKRAIEVSEILKGHS